MDRRASGVHAEGIARRFLGAHGLELICENYRCRLGELDLVMREANTLVIVEVRMRTHAYYGGAVASVDRFKQQRIVRATEHLLMKHPGLRALPVRFDVVSYEPRSEQRIEWIRGAFASAR